MADAGLWYESRSLGIGLKFFRHVDKAISPITRHPEAGPMLFEPFRRVLVPCFSFGIFYTIGANVIIVHAVFHLSRDPDKIRQLLESGSDEPHDGTED